MAERDIEAKDLSSGPPGRPNDSHTSASPASVSPKPSDIEAATHFSPSSREPEQPNGGYGWVCVACCFLINAHTWGINSSFGVFLSYYLSTSRFPGATYLDFAFVGGLSIAGAVLLAPLATICTRRFGTRTTLLLGAAMEAGALLGASWASQTWQLFLSQGAGFGFGMGFLFIGSVGVVPQWFTTKRSLANGIATAGSGLGGMVYSLATGAMLPTLGLAWAFRVLGIVACVVNVACALVIRDRNRAIGASQQAFDYRMFARREFVLMQAWAFFSLLGYVVLLFSLPNYVLSVGLTPSQGAIVGALLNLGQGLGRPLVGIFSDRAGRINVAALLTFFCGFLCLVCWIFAKSYGVLIFFAILGGTVAGTVWTTVGPVGAEVVGLKELPSALALTWVVLVLPSACTSSPLPLLLQPWTWARAALALACGNFNRPS